MAALRANALTRDGALAAFVVGTLTYASGGWAFTLVLLAFFLPSVALSRLGRARKKQLVDIGKGGARDGWQVLANGGVATLCALVAGVALGTQQRDGAQTDFGATTFVVFVVRIFGARHMLQLEVIPWLAAFAGSYAAATADTWGTEIGTLIRGKPRSILTLRPIPAGLSGGITWAGTAAEAGGAAWIGLATAASLVLTANPQAFGAVGTALHAIFLPVAAGGVAGALVDSVLGATLQELRFCPACKRTCETNPHICDTPTTRVRGLPGFSNDAVNFAATLTGALVAYFSAAR